MLYRVETGLHANITDTQGRKTALHLLKALQIPVAAIRQIKVYTVDGLDAAQVNRLVDEGIWHDPILQQASLHVGLTADAHFIASDGSEYSAYRDFYSTAPASLR